MIYCWKSLCIASIAMLLDKYYDDGFLYCSVINILYSNGTKL